MKKIYDKVVRLISYFIPSKLSRRKFKEKYLISNYKMIRKKYKYIGDYTYFSGGMPEIISQETKIGKFCSFAKEVVIGVADHPIDFITTHGIARHQCGNGLYEGIITPTKNVINYEGITPITIGNDVWVGRRVIILNGVSIGDGAVVGAGAIVTKDIPPYEVWGGVPAKFIKKRFSNEIIEKLLKLKWWDYPNEVIVNLPFDNIEKCIEILEQESRINKQFNKTTYN